jgi:hypothetical protein
MVSHIVLPSAASSVLTAAWHDTHCSTLPTLFSSREPREPASYQRAFARNSSLPILPFFKFLYTLQISVHTPLSQRVLPSSPQTGSYLPFNLQLSKSFVSAIIPAFAEHPPFPLTVRSTMHAVCF